MWQVEGLRVKNPVFIGLVALLWLGLLGAPVMAAPDVNVAEHQVTFPQVSVYFSPTGGNRLADAAAEVGLGDRMVFRMRVSTANYRIDGRDGDMYQYHFDLQRPLNDNIGIFGTLSFRNWAAEKYSTWPDSQSRDGVGAGVIGRLPLKEWASAYGTASFVQYGNTQPLSEYTAGLDLQPPGHLGVNLGYKGTSYSSSGLGMGLYWKFKI